MFPSAAGFPQYGFDSSIFGGGFNSGNLQYGGIDSGIAQFEGFYQTGSVAARNNNPGNIMFGPFAQQYGATGADNRGFAVFPDAQTGFGATDALVGRYAQQGYSLSDLIDRWSPPNAPGNSPDINAHYVDFISQKTGINPDAPISGQEAAAGSGIFSGVLGGVLSGIPGIGDLMNGAKIFGSIPGVKNMIPNPLQSFSWGRVAAFVLGILFIGAGLYLFKPVQEVVNNTVKETGKAAGEVVTAAAIA